MTHLEKMNETYWQHARFACWAAWQCVLAALTLLVHAALPQRFEYSASARLRHLLERSMSRSHDATVARTDAYLRGLSTRGPNGPVFGEPTKADNPAGWTVEEIGAVVAPGASQEELKGTLLKIETVLGTDLPPREIDRQFFNGQPFVVTNKKVPHCPSCGINLLMMGCFCAERDDEAIHAKVVPAEEHRHRPAGYDGWSRQSSFRLKD